MQFTPQRLERVYRSMRREEINALVVTRRQDVQYLTGHLGTGHHAPIGCVITEGSQPHLIVTDAQEASLASETILGEIRSFTLDSSTDDQFRPYNKAYWQEILRSLNDLNKSKGMIGFQLDSLSVKDYEFVKTLLPDAGFRDFSQALWRLRHIKDAAEIDAIRQAVNIAEIGVRTALEIVASGKSEDDASLEIEAAMRGAGGQQRGIRAAVLSADHARFPFAQPGSKRIKSTDFVVLDITVSHSGYFAEITRTIHLGKPTNSQRKLFNYVLNIMKNTEKIMAPELTIEEVSSQILKKAGKTFPPETIILPLGSSIGLDLREPPFISVGSQYSLREGMVFTLHPIGYVSDVGCVKIADVFLVRHDKVENLGSLARETL
ncbi:aminopeptidase P family protein [Candidatus Thorarchaeota archaeon]|nr:MAG: aminopeptidase P family protein [Candidatus Thorarchaeota archaeon]